MKTLRLVKILRPKACRGASAASRTPAGRPNRRRSGQIIILTAIIITIVVLSLVSLVSQTVNLRQNLRYEPYKEVTEDLAASFRNALAFSLANMTEYYNATGDDVGGRNGVLRYLSKWKEAAMRAYADLGLQVDFTTPLDVNSSYVLQGAKTITYKGIEESIDAWKIYNLSQLYWDQSMGCSVAYATLCINLTEYGFYGWRKDIIVASNATLYPDSLTGVSGRSPGDVVLVLDASGSMLWQDLTSLQYPNSRDQNDHLMHVNGTIGPNSGWKTVGSFNVGEIPTEFAAILDQDRSDLEFRLVNGSYNVQLVITYTNASPGVFTQILPAIADSSVRSRYPNNNYGSDQNLEVSGSRTASATDYYRTWLKFDLTSIPAELIVSAILTVYVKSQLSASGRTYYLHHSSTDTWKESGTGSITWNNQPSFSSSHVDARAPSRGLMTWDVTSDVGNDYADNKLSTWVIKDPSEGSYTSRYIIMYSKEGGGITGYNLLPSSSLSSYPGPGKRAAWSTNDGSALPDNVGNFGRSSMWYYGKNGTWSIQLRNSGSLTLGYNVDVYARKLDEARNAATTFLRLLNPNLDRIAIVQYGPGSSRWQEGTYYYAAAISSAGGSAFYDLNDVSDFKKAIDDINWRNPSGSDTIGYGFERIGGTTYQGGATPLGAGLEVGNRLFNGTNGARDGSQRILIAITDGKENVKPNSSVPGWDGACPPGGPGIYSQAGFDYSIDSDLPGDARMPPPSGSNVTTYTIGFGLDVDESSLAQLAQQGQGKYYFAANGTELAQILAGLAYGMNDKLNFHFSLQQEHEAGINFLLSSDLTVYFTDPITHQRHKVDPSYFRYEGGGNFVVTASFAGSQTPEAVDLVVRDPRGILVRIHVPLAYWGA